MMNCQYGFETSHLCLAADARAMSMIRSESVDLVITSPPYPMIQMWDALFSGLSASVRIALERNDGAGAWEAMHEELDKTWRELFRVLRPGGFACINIGDATRTLDNHFRLFANHARIISHCNAIGFDSLPLILWKKTTNAPNKFMGSGMLPSGAYVTLEHEYILIFRKGKKKEFRTPAEKNRRMESSFFWEERNIWFSDTWNLTGVQQRLDHTDLRNRSAAFPFELAWRLVNMYSLYGDTVLDPFAGTGTTTLAAITAGRNSIAADIDGAFVPFIISESSRFIPDATAIVADRFQKHLQFVKKRTAEKGAPKYINTQHGFNVMTKQETEICCRVPLLIQHQNHDSLRVSYKTFDISDLSVNNVNMR